VAWLAASNRAIRRPDLLVSGRNLVISDGYERTYPELTSVRLREGLGWWPKARLSASTEAASAYVGNYSDYNCGGIPTTKEPPRFRSDTRFSEPQSHGAARC
jgi:hypothetical protein